MIRLKELQKKLSRFGARLSYSWVSYTRISYIEIRGFFQAEKVLLVAIMAAALTISMPPPNASGDEISSEATPNNSSVMRARYQALQERLEAVQQEMKALSSRLSDTKKPHAKNAQKKNAAKSGHVKGGGNAKPAIQRKSAYVKGALSEQERLYDSAYQAFIEGNYDKSERLFNKLIKKHPRNVLSQKAHIWLAEIYMSRGDREKALAYFNKAGKAYSPVVRTKRKLAVKQLAPTTHPPEKASTLSEQDRSLAAADLSAGHPPDFADGPMGARVARGSRQDFIVNIGDRVFFDTDEASLTSYALTVLEDQVHWLRRNPHYTILVEGHADERGTREYNIALGAKRANSVRIFLLDEGIAPARVRTISYGKERPVALCDHISCWAQNRRAVIRLKGAPPSVKTEPEKPAKRRKSRVVWRGFEESYIYRMSSKRSNGGR